MENCHSYICISLSLYITLLHQGLFAVGGDFLDILLGGSRGMPHPENVYKTAALRLNLVGFASLADYPKFCVHTTPHFTVECNYDIVFRLIFNFC